MNYSLPISLFSILWVWIMLNHELPYHWNRHASFSCNTKEKHNNLYEVQPNLKQRGNENPFT